MCVCVRVCLCVCVCEETGGASRSAILLFKKTYTDNIMKKCKQEIRIQTKMSNTANSFHGLLYNKYICFHGG